MLARPALLALALSATGTLPCVAQDAVLELVTAGFDAPTSLAAIPGDPTRFLVSEKRGLVHVVRDGALLSQPFLDLAGQVEALFFESGLLSVATHPGYDTNGRFFVAYVDLDGVLVVDEYEVSSDPDVALPDVVQRIYEAPMSSIGHYSGGLAFGAGGKLFVTLGDLTVMDAAQDLGDPRGKLLRLDVDVPAPFLPGDNPFVGVPGALPEIWALGLRNPWRLTFDRETGDLWFADVGWQDREEVHVQASGSTGGENYGWPCFEGFLCHPSASCDCLATGFTRPAIDYDHLQGPDHNCIVGGYVYRGNALPALAGRYVHADWTSGKLWAFDYSTGVVLDWEELDIQPAPIRPQAFGEDLAGELYLLDGGAGAPGDGRLLRFVPPCGTTSVCHSTANSTGSVGTIQATGSTSLGQADFGLLAQGLVPGGFGLFFYGPEEVRVPFGDGYLCVGAGTLDLFRLPPPIAVTSGGGVTLLVDLVGIPAGSGPGKLTPGSRWVFQCWYRDPLSVSGFNLTDGLEASFCP